MICLFHSSTFEVCDHNAVMVHPCSSATADLSLATLLKTAVVVPFFLTRKLRRGTGVFFCIHIQRDFSDAQCSFASAPGASQMSAEHGKGTSAKWASVEQRNAVRLYVSKTICPVSRHCAHGARSDRVIRNKHTRDRIRVCRQLSHEINKKGD